MTDNFFINLDYNSSERFDMAKFMPYLTDNYDVLNSYFLDNLKSLPVKGTFKVVAEEERPDLISWKLYNLVDYWWLLLLYNDIIDLSEIKAGKIIKYFSQTDLETLYFNLRSLQGNI